MQRGCEEDGRRENTDGSVNNPNCSDLLFLTAGSQSAEGEGSRNQETSDFHSDLSDFLVGNLEAVGASLQCRTTETVKESEHESLKNRRDVMEENVAHSS